MIVVGLWHSESAPDSRKRITVTINTTRTIMKLTMAKKRALQKFLKHTFPAGIQSYNDFIKRLEAIQISIRQACVCKKSLF